MTVPSEPCPKHRHIQQWYPTTKLRILPTSKALNFLVVRPPLHLARFRLRVRGAGIDAPHRPGLCSIRPSIGTENFVPEEMDHREIGVRVPVMNEVKFLFASEPCKP